MHFYALCVFCFLKEKSFKPFYDEGVFVLYSTACALFDLKKYNKTYFHRIREIEFSSFFSKRSLFHFFASELRLISYTIITFTYYFVKIRRMPLTLFAFLRSTELHELHFIQKNPTTVAFYCFSFFCFRIPFQERRQSAPGILENLNIKSSSSGIAFSKAFFCLFFCII